MLYQLQRKKTNFTVIKRIFTKRSLKIKIKRPPLLQNSSFTPASRIPADSETNAVDTPTDALTSDPSKPFKSPFADGK